MSFSLSIPQVFTLVLQPGRGFELKTTSTLFPVRPVSYPWVLAMGVASRDVYRTPIASKHLQLTTAACCLFVQIWLEGLHDNSGGLGDEQSGADKQTSRQRRSVNCDNMYVCDEYKVDLKPRRRV
ncbi:unnamed protein product [Ectocarpus fasciculatus]